MFAFSVISKILGQYFCNFRKIALNILFKQNIYRFVNEFIGQNNYLYPNRFFILNTRLAFILSIIGHPLLMPTYLLGIIIGISPEVIGLSSMPMMTSAALLGVIFVYTFAIPAYAIYLMKNWGIIQSMTLEKLQDRRYPYLFTALLYGLFGGFLYFKIPNLYAIGFLIMVIAFIILLIAWISLWWQISAHAAGVGGVIGTLAMMIIKFGAFELFFAFLATLIFSGYILSARLALQAHTTLQVFWGLVLALLTTIVSLLYILV